MNKHCRIATKAEVAERCCRIKAKKKIKQRVEVQEGACSGAKGHGEEDHCKYPFPCLAPRKVLPEESRTYER